MDARKCDRCGACFDYDCGGTSTATGMKYEARFIKEKSFDLCPDCMDAFYKFMGIGNAEVPADEERPTGKWVVDIIGHKGDKTTIMRFKCSNCGTVISWIPGEKYPTKESFLNAHPGCFCGARMEAAE